MFVSGFLSQANDVEFVPAAKTLPARQNTANERAARDFRRVWVRGRWGWLLAATKWFIVLTIGVRFHMARPPWGSSRGAGETQPVAGSCRGGSPPLRGNRSAAVAISESSERTGSCRFHRRTRSRRETTSHGGVRWLRSLVNHGFAGDDAGAFHGTIPLGQIPLEALTFERS